MKIRSNILILGLIFSLVCFVGCKGKKKQSEAESKSAEPNIVQPVKVDSGANEPNVVKPPVIEPNTTVKIEPKQVIATVNGVVILKSDYEARVEQQIGKVQKQMPAAFLEQYKKELGKKVLDEMIVDILIDQKAKQKGIVVTDQEIDNRINEVARRQKMSLQDYRDMLTATYAPFSGGSNL